MITKIGLNTRALKSLAKVPDKLLAGTVSGDKAIKFFSNMRNNEDLFQRVFLGMIVARHFYGTLVYTVASWYNTGMPKEQRRFAAAIDLMNGITNFAFILGVGELIINRNSKKWAEKLLKDLKHDPKKFEMAKLGFRSLLTVGVSGVISQRILTPFIATPAAKWFKEKYFMKEQDQKLFRYPKNLAIKQNQPSKAATSFQLSQHRQDPFSQFTQQAHPTVKNQ